MTELLRVAMEDGGAILVEAIDADDRPDGGVVKAGRPGDGLLRAAHSLDEAMEPIATAARTVLQKLRATAPDEVTVEFGVRFSAELGAIVTRAGSECNLRITVRWDRAHDRTR